MPSRFSQLALGCYMLSVATAVFTLGLSPQAVQAQAAPGVTFSSLYSFPVPNTNGDGSYPDSSLVQGSDGNYYGTTRLGGPAGVGTVFQITPSGALTTLHTFSGTDGSEPRDGLTLGSDGNFYGTTAFGGVNDYGTVFKITPAGALTTIYSFTSGSDGAFPLAGLTLGSDGDFYGTNEQFNSTGVVFKITPSGALTTLYSFNGGVNGGLPDTRLRLGSDGNFYGSTEYGGANEDGTLFKITPSGDLTTLYSFSGGAGTGSTEPVLDQSGNIYGVTYDGGANNDGSVYKVDASGTMTTLHSFNGSDGMSPRAGLTVGSGGNFYGSTSAGGANSLGTVFKITPSGTFTTLHNFTAAEGNQPRSFIVGANGSLYANANEGGASDDGTVFKVTTSGSLTTLYSFSAVATAGSRPEGELTVGGDGSIYGATSNGGVNHFYGTLYKAALDGAFTLLHGFNDSDGAQPNGGLVFGTDGSIYGTAYEDGANESGTIFKLAPTGALTTLHNFDEIEQPINTSTNSDGAYPEGGLTLGVDGYLYGTTQMGGASANGTLFKISTSGAFSVLDTSLSTTNGVTYTSYMAPQGELTLGPDGDLYGAAQYGGAVQDGQYFDGSVFKASASGALTTLYTFSQEINYATNSDGAGPLGPVTLGRDGAFYGTAIGGGSNGNGTIYKVTPSGVETTQHTFSATNSQNINTDGAFPAGKLILGSDGNFYGSTQGGGATGSGTIFQITLSGTLTTLYSFQSSANSGSGNGCALVEGTDGALYGTTYDGGSYGYGSIFKLSVPSLSDSTRFDFNRDGHSDLVWYNTGTGGVSVWDMDDQSVLSYGATFTQLAPSSGWVPVATPDINADGYPDLLWWNKNTGELSFWTLQNTTVLHYYGDFATVADTDWKPVAAADVTGTTWELVFQNTATGAVSAWDMNGQTVTSYGPTLATLGANTPYQVVGAPDLDGDGKSDLLFWDSQTGGVSYWSCNLAASQVLSYHSDFTSLDDTSWHLVGSEDTNGDGRTDLLWWNAGTGEVSRWLLDGTTVTQYGGDSGKVPDTTWQPTAIR